MKRRLLALCLAAALCLSAAPGALALEGDATPSVYDEETGVQLLSIANVIRPQEAANILEARLAQFQEQYPKGTSNGNCFTFAQAVQAFLFDQSFNYSYHGNLRDNGHLIRVGRLGYDCDPEDQTSNSSINGAVDGEISEENVQALLQQAKVGDVIQGLSHNDSGMHTMVVQQVTETGVVVYHGNWNSVVSVTHLTWSYFATKWPHVLTLYRADNYDTVAAKTSLTVSFNANGGSGAGAARSVTWHGTYPAMAAPTRSGYSFQGWYTAKSGGTKVSAGDTVLLGKNATLYAHWAGESVTVTFDARGGTVSPASKAVQNGASYGTLPTPTRSGYTFSGWYTSASGGLQVTASSTVSLSGNATLYAHWNNTVEDPSVSSKLEVTASSLNVRAEPSSAGRILGRLKKGTIVDYQGQRSGDWYHISSGSLTGWCSGEYLKEVVQQDPISEPYTVTARLWCRSAPSATASTVGVFEQGTVVTVTGAAKNGFLPVTGSGLTGWCAAQYLTPGDQTNVAGKRYTVTASKLWCRSGPTSSAATVGSFQKGTVVTATGTAQNGWLPVTALGVSGWCSMDYLDAVTVLPCPFKDVPSGSWYYDGVVWAYNGKIMTGTSATAFSPGATATRAMFVTVLGRYLESLGKTLTSGAATFPDLDQGAYYYDYVRWGVSAGIATGSGGRFHPDDGITRQELAVFLHRFARYRGQSVSVSGTSKWNTFSDRGQVAGWAQDAMKWAVEKGYITGSGGKLNPHGTATRAEVVTVLRRYAG